MQKLNKKHYVYVLISNVEEKFYIGARSCSCEVDEDSYMGSSSVMTKEDKDNCDKLVLKEFDTRKEAIAYEVELHNQFEVSTNERFWNNAKQTSTKFDTSGTTLTDEHKEKISQGLLGKIHSTETISKIQKAHRDRAVKHWKFKPWYYEVAGVKIEVFDKTIRQFAEETNVRFDAVKDRFKKKFEDKEVTKGVLKGYKFGRIRNGK